MVLHTIFFPGSRNVASLWKQLYFGNEMGEVLTEKVLDHLNQHMFKKEGGTIERINSWRWTFTNKYIFSGDDAFQVVSRDEHITSLNVIKKITGWETASWATSHSHNREKHHQGNQGHDARHQQLPWYNLPISWKPWQPQKWQLEKLRELQIY